MMIKKLRAKSCLYITLLSIGFGLWLNPSRCSATFNFPVAVNSNAATDSATDNQAWFDYSNGTWVAVWVTVGANPVDPAGDDPATGDNLNQDIYFARSTDNGQTWSTRAVLKTNAASDRADDIESLIASDKHGHWMVVWRSKDPLGGTIGYDTDILMAYSGDDGLTWSAPTPVNNDAASDPGGSSTSTVGISDTSPMVCGDGQGHWMTAWIRHDNTTGAWRNSMAVATSSDNGAHWSTPHLQQTRIESGMGGFGGPYLATDGKGHWIHVWPSRTSSSSDYDIYCAISTDNGASWTTPTPLNTNAATDSGDDDCPVITTDGQGHWLTAWHSTDSLGGAIGTDLDCLYSTSNDNGQTWSAPAPINSDAATDGTGVDMLPFAIYDGIGNWVVAWQTTKMGGDTDFYYSTSPVGNIQWTPMHPLNPWAMTDSSSAMDNSVRLASDGQGHWMALWSSNYNPLTQTTGDYDIISMYNPASQVPVQLSHFSAK